MPALRRRTTDTAAFDTVGQPHSTAPPACWPGVPAAPPTGKAYLAPPFHVKEFAVFQTTHNDPPSGKVIDVYAVPAQATAQPMAA
jgi:hypothetical protein